MIQSRLMRLLGSVRLEQKRLDSARLDSARLGSALLDHAAWRRCVRILCKVNGPAGRCSILVSQARFRYTRLDLVRVLAAF
jgi:hypothetical protein